MNPTEKASELFAAGYSCSQAVLASRAGRYGLSDEAAFKISAAFGGGWAARVKSAGRPAAR